MALISHAVGRQDRKDANYVCSNQSVAMSRCVTRFTLAGGYGLSGAYMRALAADAAM